LELIAYYIYCLMELIAYYDVRTTKYLVPTCYLLLNSDCLPLTN